MSRFIVRGYINGTAKAAIAYTQNGPGPYDVVRQMLHRHPEWRDCAYWTAYNCENGQEFLLRAVQPEPTIELEAP